MKVKIEYEIINPKKIIHSNKSEAYMKNYYEKKGYKVYYGRECQIIVA